MMTGLVIFLLLLMLTGCGAGSGTGANPPQEPHTAPPALRIAVLDSGISRDGDFLLETGWNYLDETESTRDDKGHGTQVAELIRRYAPGATLVPLKVSDSLSDTSSEIVVRAIYDAVDRFDCDVLCLAFSIPPGDALEKAIAYAEQQQAVVVSAAGNLGQTYKKDKLLYPAAYETVIGVGAVGEDGVVAPYSQRSRSVLVTAPGTSPDGTQQGTSFAAARVAGICAGIRWNTPEECRQALRRQAADRGPAGYDTDYGWGVLDPDGTMGSISE